MSKCPIESYHSFLESIKLSTLEIKETYHPTIKSSWSILERTRTTNYLGFIQSGMLRYIFDNQTITLPQNSIMLIPANMKHSIKSSLDEHVSFYTIHFHTNTNPKMDSPFSFTLIHPQKTQMLFNDIYNYEHNKRNIHNQSLLKSLHLYLMHEIYEQYKNTNFLNQNTYLKIEEIKQSIDNSPLKPKSVSDLSHQFGLSRKYATTLFKKKYGMSIKTYHIQKRIEHATFLLEETNLTFTQIAYTCGYSDPYAFSKQYKKYKGISPSLWKKNRKIDN